MISVKDYLPLYLPILSEDLNFFTAVKTKLEFFFSRDRYIALIKGAKQQLTSILTRKKNDESIDPLLIHP